MPGAGTSEIYFIAAMMILIIVLCIFAVYFFIKTYKKEMKEKEARLRKEPADAASEQAGE